MSEECELPLSDNLELNVQRNNGGVQFRLGPYIRHGDEPSLVGTMSRDNAILLMEYLDRLTDGAPE